jgi:hypothetical protein
MLDVKISFQFLVFLTAPDFVGGPLNNVKEKYETNEK